MSPIFPADNRTVLTGFVGALVIWIDVLENIFSESVDGIDCILETSTNQTYTYTVIEGIAQYLGEGDLHTDKSKFNKHGKSVSFVDESEFAATSPQYTVTFYPNEDFFVTYHTTNPWVASFVAVAIVLFTCILFFAYDHFVLREVRLKQQLLTAKRHFMRYVSHEVRTPLNSVCMDLDLVQTEIANALGFDSASDLKKGLEEKGSAAEDKEEKASIPSRDAVGWFMLTSDIAENAESAVAVLTDMLNYDKVEGGNLSLELTPLPIFSLITRTVDEFRLSAGSKQLKLETILVSQDNEQFSTLEEVTHIMRNLYVIGDSVRLTQVFRNFLSNAIKFSSESSTIQVKSVWEDETGKNEKPIVEFKLKDDQMVQLSPRGQIVLHVKDSGAGMSPEQLSKLFTAGTQFNANELQAGKGSGLGLYITKGIIEQHNGTVMAESDGFGKGTTFIMKLPVYCTPDVESGVGLFDPTPEKEEFTVSDDPLRARNILVVDDATSNRKLLTRLLENNGHTCEQAVDGQDCLDKVEAVTKEGREFDLILLDYEMPNMNGPDCAQQLRSLGCSTLIVGLTGNCLAEDVELFKASGVDDVLPKPFRMKALQDIWEKMSV